VSERTASGLLKFRALRPGARVGVVAPASAFDRAQFDAGMAELRRLGFDAVFDETVFERGLFSAGSAETRAKALMHAFTAPGIDAVMSVRGGYGSVEALPLLDHRAIRESRRPFIGYSDVTSLHAYLAAAAGIASVYGPMLEGRFGKGPDHYDVPRFLQSVSDEPMGDLAPEGLQLLQPGEAAAPLAGGTLTQLLASFETPFVFQPPQPHVLLIEDVGERPYRIHRMLTQWRLSGRFEHAAAIVFGQFPQCEEPNSTLTAIDAVRECLAGFTGPVVFGFPAGHVTTPLISLPLGVQTRVIAGRGSARLVLEEAAGYCDV
jgi:muramoyltetrapeptide carboxypeptidase